MSACSLFGCSLPSFFWGVDERILAHKNARAVAIVPREKILY